MERCCFACKGLWFHKWAFRVKKYSQRTADCLQQQQIIKSELSDLLNHSFNLSGGVCDTVHCTPMWYKTEAGPLEIADRRACGVSDVNRDQLLESQPRLPLMLQQLCLLRPHIPAGQAIFTLITCADLRARQALRGTSQLHEFKSFCL